MVPIKYRAKRICDDELKDFVYGYFTQNSGLMPGNVIETEDNDYPVAIKTLGIYTGFDDINGKEIYTGDIIKCHSNSLRADLGCLVCTFYLGAYVLVSPDYVADAMKYKMPMTYPIWRFEKEVVGNIFENITTIENTDDIED